MKEKITHFPEQYKDIEHETKGSGFTMASDVLTNSLLRTLASAKPSATFLELGTGTGLATCWILDGMDNHSSLISIDNDPAYLNIARSFLENDKRLQLICSDGAEWIEANSKLRFDFIFADTWHGKFLLLDEVLEMLNKGGLYIIDDMLPQANWPEGHAEKVDGLIQRLRLRNDLVVTEQAWSTGIIIAVKK